MIHFANHLYNVYHNNYHDTSPSKLVQKMAETLFGETGWYLSLFCSQFARLTQVIMYTLGEFALINTSSIIIAECVSQWHWVRTECRCRPTIDLFCIFTDTQCYYHSHTVQYKSKAWYSWYSGSGMNSNANATIEVSRKTDNVALTYISYSFRKGLCNHIWGITINRRLIPSYQLVANFWKLRGSKPDSVCTKTIH